MNMEEEVVRFFKRKLIEAEGSIVRGRNVVGFFAFNARVRKWFLERYPTEVAYMQFFHKHPNDFKYTIEEGLTVNKNPFYLPDSIRDLEQYDARQSLEEVEKSIAEVEIFAFIFFDLIAHEDRSQDVSLERYLASENDYYQSLIERLNLRRDDLLRQIAQYRNVMKITDGNRSVKLGPSCIDNSSFAEGMVTRQMDAMVKKYLKALVDCNIVKLVDVDDRFKRFKILSPRVLGGDSIEDYIKSRLNQTYVVKTKRGEKFISLFKVEAEAKPSSHVIVYEKCGSFLAEVHGSIQKLRKDKALVKVDSEKHPDYEGLAIELDVARLDGLFPNNSDLHKIYEEMDEIVIDAEYDERAQKYYVLDIRGI